VLAHSQIAQLYHLLISYENIEAFDIPVNNIVFVQKLDSFQDLLSIVPDFLLRQIFLLVFLFFQNLNREFKDEILKL
jgi:hypothetical protein